MNFFLSTAQAFFVQDRIDLPGARVGNLLRACPGGGERGRRGTPAIEAGPVPGGQRDRFVEEEQLGPAAPPHDLAANAAELELADDPGLVSPAAAEQLAGGGVVQDAAIAGEQASLFDG